MTKRIQEANNDLYAEFGPITVAGTGNTTLAQWQVHNDERVYVSISVATQALDAFIIQGRAHANDSFQTFYSSAVDYTSPAGILLGTSSDLTTIGAGSTGWFILETQGIWEVRLQASAAADSAAVTLWARGE